MASADSESEGEVIDGGPSSSSAFQHHTRGRGRSKIVRTGERGRPRKQYRANTAEEGEEIETELTESTFLSEMKSIIRNNTHGSS